MHLEKCRFNLNMHDEKCRLWHDMHSLRCKFSTFELNNQEKSCQNTMFYRKLAYSGTYQFSTPCLQSEVRSAKIGSFWCPFVHKRTIKMDKMTISLVGYRCSTLVVPCVTLWWYRPYHSDGTDTQSALWAWIWGAPWAWLQCGILPSSQSTSKIRMFDYFLRFRREGPSLYKALHNKGESLRKKY